MVVNKVCASDAVRVASQIRPSNILDNEKCGRAAGVGLVEGGGGSSWKHSKHWRYGKRTRRCGRLHDLRSITHVYVAPAGECGGRRGKTRQRPAG